jgi:preprotein translocase subunit YajC
MGPLIAIALMFLVFWVLIILPQQRRVRAHQTLVRSIAVGDEVMTTSGLYGTIASLDEDDVMLEVAPGTTLRLARGAIAKKVDEPVPEPPAAEDTDETAETAETEATGSVTTPSDNPE